MRLELDRVQMWGARGSFRARRLSSAGKCMSRVTRLGSSWHVWKRAGLGGCGEGCDPTVGKEARPTCNDDVEATGGF